MINLRPDRFLTLHFFRYRVKRRMSGDKKHIPILMYHSISDQEEKLHPYYRLNTSPAVFNSHMRYLSDNHYTAINLRDLENNFTADNSSRYIVLTFDDGFYDFFIKAFPVLKKYKFCATVFLPTGFIHNQRSSFKDKECMTWDEVRALCKEGINFGSHTVTHPQLSKLTAKEIEFEIKQSKNKIEDETNAKVDSFSYPFAFSEDFKLKNTLRVFLEKCGYTNGVTTAIGTANNVHDIFFEPRLPVNSADDILFFDAKLRGAYDWLSKPQKLVKRIKG